MVRAEAVFDVEDAPRAPLPAHELALDGPERVGGEAHAVVLVRLRDDAGLAHLEEVDRDAEVVGCEVREPVGGRLVAHAVGVAQILDGEGAALLGPGHELGRAVFRDEERAREVVRLHPLEEELCVVARGLVAEHVARDGLQDDRSRVRIRRLGERHVDAPVSPVDHRAGGDGEVTHVVQRQPQMRRDIGCRALRERAVVVPDAREQRGRPLLDLRVVVVPFAHGEAELRVRSPRLLRGRRPLRVDPRELAVERQDRLDGLVAQRATDAKWLESKGKRDPPGLRPLELHLEGSSLRERGVGEQFVDRHAEEARKRLQLRESNLPLPGLDRGDL
ncbi:hypothetical protein ACFPRL_03115 [Pseudoclavibacter helvolus]